MAKKKATSKRSSKTTTKKAAASSRGTRKTSKKKVGARKKRAKTSKKSTTTRKKKTIKKKSDRKKTTSKKKVAKRSTSKKTATKKTSTRKKSSSKPSAAKSKKTAKKVATKSNATGTGNKKTSTTKKKKSSSKKKSGSGKSQSKIKGRSVAEVASSAETDDQGYVVINGRRVRMLSMKGVDRTKKKKTTKVAAVETSAGELPPAQRKTKLAKKDLRYFQGLLLERRRDIVGNLGSMENEALRSNGGEISHMPIHMADIGSETYEQDFMLGLAEGERTRLKEIDRALARIAEGTYGMCMMTGKEIPRARLEAKPWARYTIEAAREMERTGYSS